MYRLWSCAYEYPCRAVPIKPDLRTWVRCVRCKSGRAKPWFTGVARGGCSRSVNRLAPAWSNLSETLIFGHVRAIQLSGCSTSCGRSLNHITRVCCCELLYLGATHEVEVVACLPQMDGRMMTFSKGGVKSRARSVRCAKTTTQHVRARFFAGRSSATSDNC